MRDLSSLTAADFEAVLDTSFDLATGEAVRLPLRLTEVTLLPGRPDRRRPFSLLFRGPRTPVLAHDTYPVAHDALGEFELFLGPIAGDPEGITYEAVFT